MKVVIKAAIVVLSLALSGSAVFAQSLADAKNAIDAEQYQKAKSMLKNLTVTQSSKDENYFFLGLVYIDQDYADSAKAVFTQGLGVNPKSALNNVGLGMVARLDKDDATAKTYFDKALALAGKDVKPYIYIAQGYLVKTPNVTPDPTSAIAILTGKAQVLGPKDPDVFITLGLAYRYMMDSNNAYLNYNQAETLDPKSPTVEVAIGVLWKFANNFDDAAGKFQAALAIDPNFGPAYRELAENDLLQAHSDMKVASAKIKEATDYYKKYLDLTDRSIETQMRYADFLIQAGDYQTLEQIATTLSKSANTNLKVYRYLAYSAYENKNYQAGLDAINIWMTKADPKRIIPRDYVYLGRLQLKTGQDSLGIISLNKALVLDSTQTDLYNEMAASYYGKRKYVLAGDMYKKFIQVSHRPKLIDYFHEGFGYFYGFEQQSAAADKDKTIKPDTSLLVQADSAFSYVMQKTNPVNASAVLYRAYVNDDKEADREKNYKGYAKPYYELYVSLVAPKNPTDGPTKQALVSAYSYLGYYYEFVAKDDAKATDNFAKAKDLDPTNKQVLAYFQRHPAAATAPKTNK